jgi:Icc-related predicted phosphoesterase
LRIVCISDTHGYHRDLKIPDCDLLIFAGDISNVGESRIIIDFNAWIKSLGIPSIIVAGNHDLSLQDDYFRETILFNGIYLNNSVTDFKGLKVYGSPMSPRVGHWGFGYSPREGYKCWEKIPIGTDILITHGPPRGILDIGGNMMSSLGGDALLNRVNKVKPKLHVFGHIHESYGISSQENTVFVNAAICGFPNHTPLNRPLIVDI